MAKAALVAMLFSPSSVAIHDDGDVSRNARRVKLLYFLAE
jgi:hypothetical protein